MPGGRLTHQERTEIASGLVRGLSFAAIARKLSRPTSTISREVLRNGGADGYQPDRAQQATSDRARRQGPIRTSRRLASSDNAGRDPATLARVERELTEALDQTGLPRMSGRVLACLYTADSGALTAAELVDRLRVSPASISKAVRELETHGHIRREREVSGRRDRYVIDADIWYESWVSNVRRLTMLAETLDRSAEALGLETEAGARLGEASQIFRDMGEELASGVERIRQRLSANHASSRG